MKGDFSRIRFEPGKHYTDVLGQQGRVAYDADANEQRFIDGHRRTVQTVDVIGEYGAPADDAGFAISTVAGGNLRIGKGRYYVHGLLCENDKPRFYGDQPFLIDDTADDNIGYLLKELVTKGTDACLRVYLEVWQRMVTALDDTCLGEPALGQADTTVRMQTVWRVVASLFVPDTLQHLGLTSELGNILMSENDEQALRLLKRSEAQLAKAVKSKAVAEPVDTSKLTDQKASNGCCCEAMYREKLPVHSGTLRARTSGNDDTCGCQPIPAAGYTGLENQLYRVEIHRSGSQSSATFKWSRENGSVVVAVLAVSGKKVTVASLGPDANLGFQVGQWVEISDDTNLFGETPNQPGELYQIEHVERSSLTLTMTTTVQSVDTNRNARMRRWDQIDTAATDEGLPLAMGWVALENGIEVCFGEGHYVCGDAWTIPARSATGKIEWPPCGSDGKKFQPPHYTTIYRAPLACIHLNRDVYKTSSRLQQEEFVEPYARAEQDIFTVDDCRRRFPCLADLGNLVDATALHVIRINWKNDDALTFDRLVEQGLAVTFDQLPTGPLSPANFIVTFETPVLVQTDQEANKMVAGKDEALQEDAGTTTDEWLAMRPPATIIRTEAIVDSVITHRGKTVKWTLPSEAAGSAQLGELRAIEAQLAIWARRRTPVRVRVKLPGRVLFASPEGGGRIYLDGQAFGETGRSVALKRERIDLRFPTGNSERASDFESWFYLYPVLGVESVNFIYTDVYVSEANGKVSIVGTNPEANTQPVVQQAQIHLTYAAVESTTIRLSMSGNTALASVPAEATVKAGDSIVTVNVAINGAPANGETERFTLTASIVSAVGQAAPHTASFSLIGRNDKQQPKMMTNKTTSKRVSTSKRKKS
jgi:Family of unknown function (DUF6519)